MDMQKFLDVVKHFEAVEPVVLKEVSDFVKLFGPKLATAFPKLAGTEAELEAGLDFLSSHSGPAFQKLDMVIDLLQKFIPKGS